MSKEYEMSAVTKDMTDAFLVRGNPHVGWGNPILVGGEDDGEMGPLVYALMLQGIPMTDFTAAPNFDATLELEDQERVFILTKSQLRTIMETIQEVLEYGNE
jgi:hypothetical protein